MKNDMLQIFLNKNFLFMWLWACTNSSFLEIARIYAPRFTGKDMNRACDFLGSRVDSNVKLSPVSLNYQRSWLMMFFSFFIDISKNGTYSVKHIWIVWLKLRRNFQSSQHFLSLGFAGKGSFYLSWNSRSQAGLVIMRAKLREGLTSHARKN